MQFVIRPNRSLTWRQTWILFIVMCVVCFGVATFWALQGFWPILPFAGLEMLLLGACLYHVSSTARQTEVVRVHERTVAVEKGRRGPEQRWEFERAWVRVALQGARHTWYPSRLVIRSHGREVEIGDFLEESERASLADDLDRAIRAG